MRIFKLISFFATTSINNRDLALLHGPTTDLWQKGNGIIQQ